MSKYNYETAQVRRGIWEIGDIINALDIGIPYVIAGGYARYCVSGHLQPIPAGDVDIFVSLTGDYYSLGTALANSKLFNVKHKSYSVVATPKQKHLPIVNLVYPRVIHDTRNTFGRIPVTDLLDGFPFAVTRAAITSEEFTEAIVDTTLNTYEMTKSVYIEANVACPVTALRHAFKYVAKGYTLYPDSIKNAMEAYLNMPYEYRLLVAQDRLDYGEI